MTTRFDIVQARRRYEEHRATHHCQIGDGCAVRKTLLRLWNGSDYSAAAKWGIEPDDAERQRRQYLVKE